MELVGGISEHVSQVLEVELRIHPLQVMCIKLLLECGQSAQTKPWFMSGTHGDSMTNTQTRTEAGRVDPAAPCCCLCDN